MASRRFAGWNGWWVHLGSRSYRHVARFAGEHRGSDDVFHRGGCVRARAHVAGRRVILKNAIGLLGGVVFGFTLAWARLTDPRVIRNMLLLKEPHVFLIMGSAVAIAAIGVRVLKLSNARCIVTGEPVDWTVEQPRTRHVAGSI